MNESTEMETYAEDPRNPFEKLTTFAHTWILYIIIGLVLAQFFALHVEHGTVTELNGVVAKQKEAVGKLNFVLHRQNHVIVAQAQLIADDNLARERQSELQARIKKRNLCTDKRRIAFASNLDAWIEGLGAVEQKIADGEISEREYDLERSAIFHRYNVARNRDKSKYNC